MALVSAVLLLAALACVVPAACVSSRPRNIADAALVVLLVAASWWSLTAVLAVSTANPRTARGWGDLEYVGMVLASAALVVFALSYTGRGPRVTRRLLAALAVEPVAVLLLLAVPATRDLLHPQRAVGSADRVGAGALYWTHVLYTEVLLVGAAALLVVGLLRTATVPRRHAAALGVVVALPALAAAAFHLGWGPAATVDPTPFAMMLSAFGLLAGVLRVPALGLHPAARRQVFATMPDPAVVLDADGRVVDANAAAEALFTAPLSHALGRPLATLLPTWREVLALPLPARAEASAGGRLFEVTRARLGEPRTGSPGSLLVARDVTARKRVEAQLEGQAGILAMIARDAPLAETLLFLVTWLEGRLTGARCAVLLRRPQGSALRVAAAPHLPIEVLTGGDTLIVAPDAGCCGRVAATRAPLVVPDLLADGRWEPTGTALLDIGVRACWVEPVVGSGTGEVRGVVTCLVAEPGAPSAEEKRLVQLAARLVDIAVERAEAHALIEHQATHDALTGLPNRVTFLDRLERALAASSRAPKGLVAVAFIDLDRFKWVNDTMGHEVGDRVLIEVASRLRQALRPADTVARFGGDEFTILLEDLADESAAVEIVDRVGEQINRPLTISGVRTPVSASIGLALARGGGRPDDLIADADAAMYRAKEHGGGRSEVYDAALRRRAEERRTLRAAILAAAERREFRVVYQPAVSLRDGRVLGAEALVRWAHPQRGLLPAAEFLPAAEEVGMGGRIGRFVLDEVVAEVARRHRPGRAHTDVLMIAVNVSRGQLLDPTFVPAVHGLLRETGGDPARLVVEVHETTLAGAGAEEIATLEQLSRLGVHLVADNFGAGTCSLQQLKRLPVSALKVDRSFIAQLGKSRGDSRLVGAVVDLAHALGLVAIAEGVETSAQLRSLQAMGCDVAQGNHLAPPGPLDDSLARLAWDRTG
ncbi:MAG TPA: EAL domain-containing protein [Mycobacteriales bacterium]|nr:EAL domain-containing protein [Mycobacteriales bacterium]